MHLPPVRDGVKHHAVPVGDVREGGEVRSAGEVKPLLDERLFDGVAVQDHHGPRAQFDLEHVAVFLRHARKIQVRRAADLRSVPDDRPGDGTGRAAGGPLPEPAPQVEGEQRSHTGH